MAYREHLNVLSKGTKAWNEWRTKHKDIKPRLSRAQLGGAKLDGVDLSRADLVGADLSGADLHRANLGSTNLAGANLHRAILDDAILLGAQLSSARLLDAYLLRAHLDGCKLLDTDLRGSKLLDATLTHATLRNADFTDADLRNVNFSEAHLGWSTFANVDLSTAIGLETITHTGPSSLGIDTLYQSGPGTIPEAFLLGVGIPQDFLDYLPPSLRASALEFYSCFISFSSKDAQFAKRLHADLKARNLRVWFAPEDLKTGDRTRRVVHDTIRCHDKLLVILTENSVMSDWVEEEVETALQKERREKSTVLFPVRLDDAVMDSDKGWAETVRDRHIGDFLNWKDHDSYKKAFERLLRDLKAVGG